MRLKCGGGGGGGIFNIHFIANICWSQAKTWCLPFWHTFGLKAKAEPSPV